MEPQNHHHDDHHQQPSTQPLLIPHPNSQPPGRWDAWKNNKDFVMKVGCLMLIFFILWLIVLGTPLLSVTVPWMIDFMETQPMPIAISVFCVAYLIGTAAYIPRSIFGAVMGYVWGFWTSVVLEAVFATLEGMAWCVIAGKWLRSCIKPSLMKNQTLRAIDRAIEDEGPSVVLLSRLVPISSFPLTNALIATSKADFWSAKVGATAIGVIPFSVLYAAVGSTASDVGSLLEEATGGGDSAEAATFRLIILVVGLLATLALVLLIGWRAKKQLGAAMDRSRAKIEEEERAHYYHLNPSLIATTLHDPRLGAISPSSTNSNTSTLSQRSTHLPLADEE